MGMCHVLSHFLLLRRIYVSRNAQGISLRSQELYLLVFLSRYTDLLTTFYGIYNSVMKSLYIVSTAGIVWTIRRKEPICSTYDASQDTFRHWKCIVLPCLVLAVLTHVISEERIWELHLLPQELLWVFSIYLEAVAILPQLDLLRRYRSVENLTANYVFFRGVYRGFYILNWIYRAHYEPGYRHHYVVYACGCMQVLLYVDFFYHWFLSRREGRELRYGDEGDTEYEFDVNELRNGDNSTSLIGEGTLRMRGRLDASDDDDEARPVLVV